MFIGTIFSGFIPFGYLVATLPWHIYLIQFFYAIAMAMVFPPWLAIFTRHIDKGREASEWGLESTSIGIGAGLSGALGGILASIYGFPVIFITTGVFSLFSAVLLLIVRKEMFPKVEKSSNIPPIVFPF